MINKESFSINFLFIGKNGFKSVLYIPIQQVQDGRYKSSDGLSSNSPAQMLYTT